MLVTKGGKRELNIAFFTSQELTSVNSPCVLFWYMFGEGPDGCVTVVV
jgi:hypothetical protein